MKNRHNEDSVADQTETDYEGEPPQNRLPHVFVYNWEAFWHLANINDEIGNRINEFVTQSVAPIIVPYCGVNELPLSFRVKRRGAFHP